MLVVVVQFGCCAQLYLPQLCLFRPVLLLLLLRMLQVYFVFFVISCVYLFIHSKRKPAPQPGLFPLGSMAEVGGQDGAVASFEAPAAAAAAAGAAPAESKSPKRAASSTSPLSAGGSLSKISPREEANS